MENQTEIMMKAKEIQAMIKILPLEVGTFNVQDLYEIYSQEEKSNGL